MYSHTIFDRFLRLHTYETTLVGKVYRKIFLDRFPVSVYNEFRQRKSPEPKFRAGSLILHIMSQIQRLISPSNSLNREINVQLYLPKKREQRKTLSKQISKEVGFIICRDSPLCQKHFEKRKVNDEFRK